MKFISKEETCIFKRNIFFFRTDMMVHVYNRRTLVVEARRFRAQDHPQLRSHLEFDLLYVGLCLNKQTKAIQNLTTTKKL